MNFPLWKQALAIAMMNLTIICDALRPKRDLQLLDLYIYTIMQTLMWTQFANYLYRNIPVEWRLQAYFLSNWFYVCTMNMLHLGIVSYINGLHVLYEIVYFCTLSWLKNSLTLKCHKSQWELFHNVTPLFKPLRTGLVSHHFCTFTSLMVRYTIDIRSISMDKPCTGVQIYMYTTHTLAVT